MSLAMSYCMTKPKERVTLKMKATESDSPGCQASGDLERGHMWGGGVLHMYWHLQIYILNFFLFSASIHVLVRCISKAIQSLPLTLQSCHKHTSPKTQGPSVLITCAPCSLSFLESITKTLCLLADAVKLLGFLWTGVLYS